MHLGIYRSREIINILISYHANHMMTEVAHNRFDLTKSITVYFFVDKSVSLLSIAVVVPFPFCIRVSVAKSLTWRSYM